MHTQVLLPFLGLIYLGLVLKKYSLEGYSDLVTNDYLLLGAWRVPAARGAWLHGRLLQ